MTNSFAYCFNTQVPFLIPDKTVCKYKPVATAGIESQQEAKINIERRGCCATLRSNLAVACPRDMKEPFLALYEIKFLLNRTTIKLFLMVGLRLVVC